MVECKLCVQLDIQSGWWVVLIDTWWNVNKYISQKMLKEIRFNRYMVECKFGYNNVQRSVWPWF